MNMIIRRSHGWQRPIHPLQMVGMAIYSFLVVTFYSFLGLFLGNTIAEITVTSVFSFLAISVMFLFIRCTAIDPTDKTSSRKKKSKKGKKKKTRAVSDFNYGYIFGQLVLRLFRKVERKILRKFIRRNYLDPWMSSGASMDPPLLPFPLVSRDDAVSPDPDLLEEEDLSFCSLCDLEVKRNSKHCRTCNRCVEGFDHHCRWLNNCVGKRNYTTFILLMVSVLLMLILEGGTAIAVFVRCFADKRGIELELKRKLYVEFPRWLLATISVLMVLLTAYGSAALGQLFFFHVVLIRKGIRTYDYILAMKESHSMELDPFDEDDDDDDEGDSDFSSDESIDFDSPEKRSTFLSRFICRGHRLKQNPPTRLSIRIDDGNPEAELSTKKTGFRVSIDPWKLIKLSREKALLAAEKAREKLARNTTEDLKHEPMKPLPVETKCGPLMSNAEAEKKIVHANSSGSTPLISKVGLSLSPGGGRFITSPRRRLSSSPTIFSSGVAPSPKHKYRSNFDLKLTQVSRELETYISRQVLCSVMKRDATEAASPR